MSDDNETKQWLDREVVPLLFGAGAERLATIYAFLWKERSDGAQAPGREDSTPTWSPSEALVFLQAESGDTWASLCARLLHSEDDAWGIDFTREIEVVRVNGEVTQIYGGDGCPMISAAGSVSMRFLRGVDKQRNENAASKLVLSVVLSTSSGTDAAAAVRSFFEKIGVDPLKLAKEYGAKWGSE